MGIVLSILKITGITLLTLLLIVILLLCLILFVPIRYKMYAGKDEKICVKAKITYLLHVVTIVGGYAEEQISAKVKVFGVTVKDFFPSEEKQKKQQEKQKNQQEKQRKRNDKLRKKEEKHRKQREKTHKQNEKTCKQDIPKQKTEVNTQERHTQQANIQEKTTQQISTQQTDFRKDMKTNVSLQRESEKQSDDVPQGEEKKNIFRKVFYFIKKLIDKIKNLKYTICNLADKLENLKETVLWYYNLLQEEETKRALKTGKMQLKRLWKHMKPQKLKGYVEFGFEDPATTGDIFGKLCMFYPLYANNVVIVPDFEKNIFKGELKLKGRIRIITILHIAWKIVFDKDIRKLYEILTGGVKYER